MLSHEEFIDAVLEHLAKHYRLYVRNREMMEVDQAITTAFTKGREIDETARAIARLIQKKRSNSEPVVLDKAFK